MLGVKIVKPVRSDAWCSDVSFSLACRWYVDGVVYWLKLVVSDVWAVWYTGWNWL